jgi:BlaI family transcriptional regulator, penicillinase repressor
VVRPASEILTARESQIMDVLWNLGAATAEQVREALPDRPHDSTIRTLLRVLETKGHVAHETRGKAFVYRASVARSKAQKRALRSVLARFFGGSAEDLVVRLIEDEQLTPEQLRGIQQSLSPERKSRRKGGRP